MMDGFGERQQALLKLLLKAKQGLTIDEFSQALKITRTAVKQHLSALERMDYIEPGNLLSTGGRPSQVYCLTSKGYDLFPKQYSWFSEVLIHAIKKEKGREGLKDWMTQLGSSIGSTLIEKTQAESLDLRTEKTVQIMNDLAYEAQAVPTSEKDGSTSIEATNCVYHGLAVQHSEVCQFDLALLSQLTQAEVTHEKCILRGENICRFRLKAFEEKKN